MNDSQKTIYIASDHAGYELKNFLVEKLTDGINAVHDLGPVSYNKDDDYPDYAGEVASAVSIIQDHVRGIVICRNGVGVCITANKVKGVRCALSWSPEHAKSAREDDNANILALPADYVSKEKALEIARVFLDTPFGNEERHVRRLAKIPA